MESCSRNGQDIDICLIRRHEYEVMMGKGKAVDPLFSRTFRGLGDPGMEKRIGIGLAPLQGVVEVEKGVRSSVCRGEVDFEKLGSGR